MKKLNDEIINSVMKEMVEAHTNQIRNHMTESSLGWPGFAARAALAIGRSQAMFDMPVKKKEPDSDQIFGLKYLWNSKLIPRMHQSLGAATLTLGELDRKMLKRELKISPFLECAQVAYSQQSYPYGKSKRGFKKFLKEHSFDEPVVREHIRFLLEKDYARKKQRNSTGNSPGFLYPTQEKYFSDAFKSRNSIPFSYRTGGK